jgi:glycosyltransferase involved in cell wall biosynthesis
MRLVSISDAQRTAIPHANFVATIHHGMPRHLIRAGSGDGGYLAFVGRISPEKRPDRAIEIARRAGLPLKIAAKVDHLDRLYFADKIQPLLDHPLIEFVGEIGDAEKGDFLGRALALLFPIDWPEPFGLVMIEAMAAGTPVIAWPGGSTSEVIEHGRTGLFVDSIDEAVAAVDAARNMSRARVRATFEERFTAERMARDHVALYRRLTGAAADPRERALEAMS